LDLGVAFSLTISVPFVNVTVLPAAIVPYKNSRNVKRFAVFDEVTNIS